MFNQPSVNQLAQTFLGNPAPLQAKVQQEQQAAPNLPPDLAQLMALQQIQETRDAAQRQQAMSQGTPPTVAQQLQQAAQPQQQVTPEMIARMMQRPRQAGIDQLPSNFGQGMAGGGIVAFDDGGSTDKSEETTGSVIGRSKGKNLLPSETGYEGMGIGEFLSSIGSEGLQKLKSMFPEGDTLANRVRKESMAEERARNMAEIAKQEPAVLERGRPTALADERLIAPIATQNAGIRAALPEAQQTTASPAMVSRGLVGPQNAPTVPRVSTQPAAQPAVPAAPSAAEQIFAKGMALDPEERQRRAEAGLQAIGGPDQEAQKRYIAELEARRAQFKKPEAGYAGLMDLLGNIAQSKGRTWMAAGAEGVQRQKENEAAMAQKDIDTLKEIMGETTKMGEAGRQFKLATYAAGQKAYDEAYKERFEAAKAQGLTDAEAKRLAQQSAEHAKTLASQENIAKLNRDAAAANRQAPTYAEMQKDKAVKAWMQANPGKTEFDAYQAMSGQASREQIAQDRINVMREKLLEGDSTYKMARMTYLDPKATPVEKAEAKNTMNQIEEMKGIKSPQPASPAVQPMPTTKEALITGNIYQTSKGPAKWNGSVFTSI